MNSTVTPRGALLLPSFPPSRSPAALPRDILVVLPQHRRASWGQGEDKKPALILKPCRSPAALCYRRQQEPVASSVRDLRGRHRAGRGDREGKLRIEVKLPQRAGNCPQAPLQPHLHGKGRRKVGRALLPQSAQDVPGLPASPGHGGTGRSTGVPRHHARSRERAALTPQR